tara:strand:+ start:152 stop:730 length:579 start_codon:yes stop_codon:yes gene_type:complete
MANQLEKFGLRPYRKLDGTPLAGAQNRYTIKANYDQNIFQGDLVIPVSTGNIERHVYNTSEAVVGVFNGCFFTDPTTQKPTYKNFYPASTNASDIVAFVVDDPDAVFLMNADAAFTRADLFKNYSLDSNNGSTTTGISQAMLDVSVSGTATTFAVQAIDISQDPENSDTSTSNANVLVRINNHFYRSGTGIA